MAKHISTLTYWKKKLSLLGVLSRNGGRFPTAIDDSTPARIEVSKLPRELATELRIAPGHKALRRQPDHFDPNTGG